MSFRLTNKARIGAGTFQATYVEIVYPRSLSQKACELEMDLIESDQGSDEDFFVRTSNSSQIVEDHKLTDRLYLWCVVGPGALKKIKAFLNENDIKTEDF